MDALVCTYQSGAMSHPGLVRDAHPAAAKKTAVLVAPPKFREETSKKAVGRSPSAILIMGASPGFAKRFLLHRSIASAAEQLCC